MESVYITFRSVTYAQRGERVLERGAIRCTLQRTPRWMEEQGCGYCLRIAWQDRERAVKLLRGAGAPFRKVYRQRRGEVLEEVAV